MFLSYSGKILINGTQWLDTEGKTIHAHGGHIVNFNGIYYWYGENRLGNAYVSCYASNDLVNWEFKRNILTTDSKSCDIGLEGNMNLVLDNHKINIERPKIIYNEKSKKYIMWAHYENGVNYSEAAIALASCDTPDGEFVYHGYFRPFGYMSRDCNVFEFEGKMYFISASNKNEDLHVYLMSEDGFGLEKRVNLLFQGQSREAPALFVYDNSIFMLTSQCTGWSPNQCGYSCGKTMTSKWENIRNCGDETTFRSQPTSVLELTVENKKQYIYIGDRWGGSCWDGKEISDFKYEYSSYYFAMIDILEDKSLRLIPCNTFMIDINGNGFEKLS